MSLILLGAFRRQFQTPPTLTPIIVTQDTFDVQVDEGDVTPRTFSIDVAGADGYPALRNLQFSAPTQPWLSIALDTGTTYIVTIEPEGVAHALETGTITITADNATADIVLTATLTEVAVPAPVLTLTPTSGLDFNGQEGVSAVSPASRIVQVTNSGTGTLDGLSVSVAYGPGASGYLSVALVGTVAPTQVVITPNGAAIGALQDGAYDYTVTVMSAAGIGGASTVDATGTLTVAPVGGTIYAPPEQPLPTGMSWDSTNGVPTGTCLQTRYYGTIADGSSVDNRVTEWVDLETVPDSLGRTLVSATSDVQRLAILQRWLNDDATGVAVKVGDVAGTPRRRGYTCDSTRNFDGQLVWPHNPATNSYTGFKPNGFVEDFTAEDAPAFADALPTFTATSSAFAALSTSISGASDSDHGRVAWQGFHVRAKATTGANVNDFSVGLVALGTTGAAQNTTTKVPAGFYLRHFTIQGQRRRYVRRGLVCQANDVELRNFVIDEIHNSYDYYNGGTGGLGLSNDAQCLTGWNAVGRWDWRHFAVNGADEGFNLGGGGPSIPNLPNVADVFMGWFEMAKSDDYMFNTENTATKNGPYNVTAPHPVTGDYAFWQQKNCFELKVGTRVTLFAARFSGGRRPNNNQGYGLTLKSNSYGSLCPTQRTEYVNCIDIWFDRMPACIALLTYESDLPSNGGGPGLPQRHVSIIDVLGWKIGETPYNQPTKRPVFAHTNASANGIPGQFLQGFSLRHATITSGLNDGGGTMFSQPDALPGVAIEDNIVPYNGAGFWISDGSSVVAFGTNALNLCAGTGNWSYKRNTFCQLAAMPTGARAHPAGVGNTAVATYAALGFVDHAAGNLRLDPSSAYYAGNANGAPDGWNRGCRNPAKTYAQLLRAPTLMTSHPTI